MTIFGLFEIQGLFTCFILKQLMQVYILLSGISPQKVICIYGTFKFILF